MKTVVVKDLMVALADYATVSQDATLYDAVLALEKAQKRYESEFSPYLHRAVLVYDEHRKMIVKDFMYSPSQGEYIPEGASLDEAIHQMLLGRHNSLLVTRREDIVGILRLTDVFAYVCQNIKACKR